MKIYWYNGRKNIIGGNVRKLRKKSNLTQKGLAERLQLSGFDVLLQNNKRNGDKFSS